jgi:hypothetical protein
MTAHFQMTDVEIKANHTDDLNLDARYVQIFKMLEKKL